MSKGNDNAGLTAAKINKKDEFYTRIEDIQREVSDYKRHFKNKVVYCNCDDPLVSDFFKYFSYNFEALGLKKLISSCYKNQKKLFIWFTKVTRIKIEFLILKK